MDWEAALDMISHNYGILLRTYVQRHKGEGRAERTGSNKQKLKEGKNEVP